MNTETVRVALEGRSYDVLVGPGLIAQAGRLIAPFAPGGRCAVATDENVARLHGEALMRSLQEAGLRAELIALPPGEHTKSFTYLEQLCGRLIDLGLERKDLIIAFGGGVIGDLAGFAAGIVKRGIEFVQIPTTLLAQVDSSVGGKTAIDVAQGKNLIGLFNQPRLVLADLDALSTLPAREVRAGYAEVVKYGLIDDPAFYEWCETHWRAVLAGEPAALQVAVAHSVRAKARVVAADEREAGQRALLNLGHTFAHALETAGGYHSTLLHGEAVGTGMALAFEYSAALGLASQETAARVGAHLSEAGFEMDLSRLPGAPFIAEQLISLMRHDKKAEAGALTLILARGIGQAFVHKKADEAALAAFLRGRLERS